MRTLQCRGTADRGTLNKLHVIRGRRPRPRHRAYKESWESAVSQWGCSHMERRSADRAGAPFRGREHPSVVPVCAGAVPP
eukprot:15433390-Alexandrium_andersonii.AAC.1